MRRIIGFDIGGTKIFGALYDEAGNKLADVKKKTKAAEGIEIVTNQIFKVVDELLKSDNQPLDGIGAGVPGLVTQKGVVTFSPNIPFKDFDLQGLLNKKYGVPVVVGNDVNVAVFGEYKFSKLGHIKNAIGLFIGTGIGGAIIIDGKLYIGQGSAGELGHMVVTAHGAYCGCGSQGCLEAYASKTAMQHHIENQLQKGRPSLLKDFAETDGSVIKSSTIQKAYEAKDALATEVVKSSAKYIGIAVGSLINIFHPELIILSGGIIESMGPAMMPILMREAQRHTMPGLLETVTFKSSKLGDEAGVYGAYQLIKAALENGKTVN